MIRPHYRWKSVWLAVLVIVFLGWAWMRSISRMEGWEYFTALTGPGMIAQRYGNVIFAWNDPTAGEDPVRFFFVEAGTEDESLPPAFELESWEIQQGRGETTRSTIAHWFLILLFLVPWSGWLIWRWRYSGLRVN